MALGIRNQCLSVPIPSGSVANASSDQPSASSLPLRASVPSCLSLCYPCRSVVAFSKRPGPSQSLRSGFAAKKRRCASPAKRENTRAPRLPSPSWLIPHGSSLPSPLRSLSLCGESLPCAHVRGAESLTSAQNSQKKSRLANCQAAFDGPRYREYLPGARRGGRGSLYRRSCSSVFTSSMSTSQFPGAGARRLWRAQANPYAAKTLVRAAVADHRDPRVTTLG